MQQDTLQIQVIPTTSPITRLKLNTNHLQINVSENGSVVETYSGNQNQAFPNPQSLLQISALNSTDRFTLLDDRTKTASINIVGSFRQVVLSLPDKRTGKNTRYGMKDAALSAFSSPFTAVFEQAHHKKRVAGQGPVLVLALLSVAGLLSIGCMTILKASTYRW